MFSIGSSLKRRGLVIGLGVIVAIAIADFLSEIVSDTSEDEVTNSSRIVTTPLNSVIGTPKNDVLQGDAKNDKLIGDAGNDELYGNAGNDALEGGTGSDLLDGGEGQDTAIYQIEAAGVIVNLATGIARDVKHSDTLTDIENIIGSEFGDRIIGNEGVNSLTGRKGNDYLEGSGGDDFILGGDGDDVLNGGAGRDLFMYLNPGDGNDKIEDFEPGIDLIVPLVEGFGSQLVTGELAERNFTVGTKATNREQVFIYNKNTGELYFDPDGNEPIVRQLIATLENAPALTARDISPL